MSDSDRTGSEEFMLQCLSVSHPRSSVLRHPSSTGGEPVDWHAVATIAADHILTPLLYKRLKESDAQALVPVDVWERLRQVYVAGAIRSMRVYRELRPVLRRLRGSGIKVVVLKGMFLAEAVYGDAALRSSMADVDIMVPREELPRVQATLLDMGFGPRERKDIELLCRTTKGLAPFTRSGFTVEPHWSLFHPTSPFRTDVDGLWARACPATIAGVEVLALSPEDLLLYLCLHTSHKHSLGLGLLPFCDIAETVRHYGPRADNRPTTEKTERVKPGSGPYHQSLRELCDSTSDSGRGSELDWSQFTDRAREWGATRHVGLALDLARSLLGAGVPDAVLEQLVPEGIDPRILETARESVLALTGYEQWVPLFDEFGARSFGDKARVSWRRVFLSRGEMASHYPDSRTSRHLYPYYALRLRDVVRAFGSYVRRRARLMMLSRGRDPSAALVKWLNGD
jgi:hypothetical protein